MTKTDKQDHAILSADAILECRHPGVASTFCYEDIALHTGKAFGQDEGKYRKGT